MVEHRSVSFSSSFEYFKRNAMCIAFQVERLLAGMHNGLIKLGRLAWQLVLRD